MKKFFTNIPIQLPGGLENMVYQAVGNDRLAMSEKTRFPILSVVHGYAERGEPFRLIAVETKGGGGSENLELLRQELDALCLRDGLACPDGVETVPAPESDRVACHIETFQRLIDLTDDGDELFACVTYGTKPMSMALLAAVRYAYRIRRNTSVPCVVYGYVDRSAGRDRKDLWKACVYDETALLQVDEMVRLLAESGVSNPQAALNAILSL